MTLRQVVNRLAELFPELTKKYSINYVGVNKEVTLQLDGHFTMYIRIRFSEAANYVDSDDVKDNYEVTDIEIDSPYIKSYSWFNVNALFNESELSTHVFFNADNFYACRKFVIAHPEFPRTVYYDGSIFKFIRNEPGDREILDITNVNTVRSVDFVSINK